MPGKKNEMNRTLNAATHFVQLNVMHFSESKSHELTHVRWGENEFGFSFCALEIKILGENQKQLFFSSF